MFKRKNKKLQEDIEQLKIYVSELSNMIDDIKCKTETGINELYRITGRCKEEYNKDNGFYFSLVPSSEESRIMKLDIWFFDNEYFDDIRICRNILTISSNEFKDNRYMYIKYSKCEEGLIIKVELKRNTHPVMKHIHLYYIQYTNVYDIGEEVIEITYKEDMDTLLIKLLFDQTYLDVTRRQVYDPKNLIEYKEDEERKMKMKVNEHDLSQITKEPAKYTEELDNDNKKTDFSTIVQTEDTPSASILNLEFSTSYKRVAEFEKVSIEEFKRAMVEKVLDPLPVTITDKDFDDIIQELYNNIKLPVRSTLGSAGYDFTTPINIKLYEGESICIPTGIRCKFNDLGYYLETHSRSSLGIFDQFHQINLTSIIDADYYYSDNEGHIMFNMVYNGIPEINKFDIEYLIKDNNAEFYRFDTTRIHDSLCRHKMFYLPAGERFIQGIFIKYGITNSEITEDIPIRNGGWGSTDGIGKA